MPGRFDNLMEGLVKRVMDPACNIHTENGILRGKFWTGAEGESMAARPGQRGGTESFVRNKAKW